MKTSSWFVSLGVASVLVIGCSRKQEFAAAALAAEPADQPASVAPAAGAASAVSGTATADQPVPEKRLPRLVDIGAGTCIPCRMMAPILDELKRTRAHEFETVFVDLNHEREKGLSYGIRVIPTQVFFDENGRELARHEGFISKEQILQAWEQLGYKFGE
jgi:thioredoxin 1